MSDDTPQPGEWPAVSVIVVTKGRHASAEKAVKSVLASDYPPELRQVVVIEETDTPAPIFPDAVHYVALPLRHKGVAFARNRGLEEAKHPIVLFTDDDCEVAREWIKEIVRPFFHPAAPAAAAGAVLAPPCGVVGKCENILGFPGGGVRYLARAAGRLMPIQTFSTCNCAIYTQRTGAVRFSEGLQYSGEDELLSRRISKSYPVLYAPRAVIYHQPRDSLKAVFRWFRNRGRSRVEMLFHCEAPGRRLLEMVFISPFLRLAAVSAAALLLGAPLAAVLAALAALYFLVVAWRFRWAWTYYPSLKVFLFLPVVKTTMDIALDIGTAQAMLRKLFRRLRPQANA